MSEELDEDYDDDLDFDEDYDDDDDCQQPETHYQRIEMLRKALNFPEREDKLFTASDLEELEEILKKHYRP